MFGFLGGGRFELYPGELVGGRLQNPADATPCAAATRIAAATAFGGSFEEVVDGSRRGACAAVRRRLTRLCLGNCRGITTASLGLLSPTNVDELRQTANRLRRHADVSSSAMRCDAILFPLSPQVLLRLWIVDCGL